LAAGLKLKINFVTPLLTTYFRPQYLRNLVFMKSFKLLFFTILFFVVFVLGANAQTIHLEQSKVSGIYKSGDNIRVTVFSEGLAPDSISVKILENYNEIQNKKIKWPGDSLVVFNGKPEGPASFIVEIKAEDEFSSIGLVVDPEEFQPGTERPKDFEKYWKNERKAFRALPTEIKSVAVENIDVNFECSDIEINCTGPKPARGYFAKPKTAVPKSLPIVLFVHAAGVKGSWCLAQPETAINYAKMGKGALAFDLNAHGMLNGQPQKYYDDLEAGELKNYFFQGLESREEFYFRGMYLRLMRTLDFLTSQPEWDGKRIIVIGESQGGGQALAAAGLDDRVTAVVATVPAMCDWGGTLTGSKGGWPQPFAQSGDQQKMLQTLPYFDAAHLLKNSKATIVTEIGFIDYTCPSNSIYAAINQSKGKKIVFGVPYRGHHVDQKQYQKIWEETVYQPKIEFIEDFLK
jgi:cephalosporin-C deacetylase-like acetyl esterase